MTDQKLTIQPAAAVRHLRHIARLQKAFAHEDVRKTPPEWLAADLIERQSAQIERMRAALEDVRPLIVNLEKMLREILNLAGQPRSADETEAFARLRSALRMIDDAMGGNDDPL